MHCETQEDAEIIHKMDMQVVERKRTVDVAGDTRCLEPWDGQSLKTLGIPGKKGPKTSKFGGNGSYEEHAAYYITFYNTVRVGAFAATVGITLATH